MAIKYPVKCPLMEFEIDMDTCFDIHMVVEGNTPAWTVPEEATKKNNYKEICNSCKYHRDD